MANKFYAAGDTRAEKVNDLFAAVAPRYDLINDLQSFGLHRLWKRRLIRMAEVAPGLRALDLCCGTGDVAFALAERGAETVGLDFSAPMLAVAEARRAKAHGSEVKGVRFMQGDALRVPFPDAHFDVVTISYGLRNLASVEAGVAEILRLLRPGGRMLVLDFGKPDNVLWRSLYFGYLRLVVPVFGRLFCGDAATHSYILESLLHYPAQQGVAAFMRDQGAQNVRIINLLGGVMSINYAEKALIPEAGM